MEYILEEYIEMIDNFLRDLDDFNIDQDKLSNLCNIIESARDDVLEHYYIYDIGNDDYIFNGDL